MAGLQGAGKTTTCAKPVLWLRREKKKKVMVVAADLGVAVDPVTGALCYTMTGNPEHGRGRNRFFVRRVGGTSRGRQSGPRLGKKPLRSDRRAPFQ